MRILITGGFGYLGGRLAKHLAATAETEIILGSRHELEPPAWLDSARVVQTPWDSQTQLALACESIHAIVHLAAMDAVDAAKDPAGALQANGVATVRLLEAAIQQGVGRFVYLSTAHVYGTSLRGSVRETTSPFPVHPYATSHRAAEDAVLAAHDLKRIEAVVLRLSNSFGAPAQAAVNCWRLLIPDLCRQAVTKNEMALRSSGAERRDFIPMSDACRAIEHVLGLPVPQLGDGLFNIGGEWSPTVWEVARLIRQRCVGLLPHPPQLVRREPRPDEVTLPLSYCIDRLRQTGFELRAKVDDEIDGLLEFCRTHFS
jgi:UDP-glucose 4-epimerase